MRKGISFEEQNHYQELSEGFVEMFFQSFDRDDSKKVKIKKVLKYGDEYDTKFFTDYGLKAHQLGKPSFRERAIEKLKTVGIDIEDEHS